MTIDIHPAAAAELAKLNARVPLEGHAAMHAFCSRMALQSPEIPIERHCHKLWLAQNPMPSASTHAAISQPAPEKPTMTQQLDQNPLTAFEAKIKAFAAANNIQGSIYAAAYSRFLATKEGKAAKAAYDSTRAYSSLAAGGVR